MNHDRPYRCDGRLQESAYNQELFPSVGTGQFCRPHWPQWGGKSTLLRVMAGLLPINRGMRHLDGKDYERYSRRLFPSA